MPKIIKTNLWKAGLLNHLVKMPSAHRGPVLVQNWHLDTQSLVRVRTTVENLLDKSLPSSYDQQSFAKNDLILNTTITPTRVKVGGFTLKSNSAFTLERPHSLIIPNIRPSRYP